MFESLDSNNYVGSNENNNTEITNAEINIEILNGTPDANKLKKVKELLEKNGYNVTKTGVTNSVAKTSIINRTDSATGAATEIKKILNTGVITTGNSSKNIDFTIIIGKDY